ncbi:TRAFAC clade GTPase domain-containing protein [Morganella morganii]|uniref:TRAFAC clade GTPase domain-containing protein n=1 Tax=Morganella morganii TaxID=582 RepID=UPI00197B8D34
MIDGADDIETGVDEDIDVFDKSNVNQVADQNLHWTMLPPSEMLTLEDADRLLRWRNAAVIAVVGERYGGKTTLVTEIYGSFLRGVFADSLFCHSLSLLGFEKKSFQSRAASGASHADTARTSLSEGLRFFHLAVCDEVDLHRRDLLISERAGEVYRDARDRPDLAVEMIELRKATVVAFIIDGGRVAVPRNRAEVFASVRNTIRAIVGSGNIAANTQIQLVTTKYDLLEGDSMIDAREALSEFEQQIITMQAEKFKVLTFRTAARNSTSSSNSTSGLDLLLKSWLKPKNTKLLEKPKIPKLSNEFDKLLLRRMVQ